MIIGGVKLMKVNKSDFQKAKVHVAVTPGEAIKIARELQELSQNELASLTGISQPNLSALENGTRQLGRDRAIALATALRIHPAVLLFPDYEINEAA
jgi:transcriptional regulator with XRE-family HTH domain